MLKRAVVVVFAVLALMLAAGVTAEAASVSWTGVGVLNDAGNDDHTGTFVGADLGVSTVSFDLHSSTSPDTCGVGYVEGTWNVVDQAGNQISGTVLSSFRPHLMYTVGGGGCTSLVVSKEHGSIDLWLRVAGGTGAYAGATGSGSFNGAGATGGPWSGKLTLTLTVP